MLRSLPLNAAVVLAIGCTSSIPRPVVVSSPLPLYAGALEEAVGVYEIEVHAAAASGQAVPEGRFEALFGASLRARGLTYAGFRALASLEPRFYFTQQALYAQRLERLETTVQAVPSPEALAAH